MEPLTMPTAEDSRRFARSLDRMSCLRAGIMSPTAGSRAVKLSNIREVAAFLKPVSDGRDMHTKIHYVEPTMLTTWLHDVIGDQELAGQMDELVASERPYGLLVPEMKEVLYQRLAQYDEALGGEEDDS